MPSDPGPQPRSPNQDARSATDIVAICVTLLSLISLPFTRIRCGVYAYKAGPFSLLAMCFWLGHTRSLTVFRFMGVWIVAVIVQRIMSSRREASRYEGRPWLVMLLPFIKTEEAAVAMEPLIVALIGFLLVPYSEPLALMILASAFGLAVLHGIHVGIRRREEIAMNDAEIEMEEHLYRSRNRKS